MPPIGAAGVSLSPALAHLAPRTAQSATKELSLMPQPHARTIPDGFFLGAATASYQIEGAAFEDGRTASIWDAFARVPGAVVGGDHGDVACDHYHRMPADVALMRELGLERYRFSTSWSRIRPDGGPVNPRGIDFYSRLVDELLEAGIAPWLTLYHWELPQVLEDRGGWTNRDTAYRFRDFALDMHAALGDRVRQWTTLNEPWCASYLSYTAGAHAPGRTSPRDGVRAAHHLLLAHGLSAAALREADPSIDLGISLNLTVARPANPSRPGDVDAARRIDGQFNRTFLDPIFRGSYPNDFRADLAAVGLGEALDECVAEGDLETISTPIDTLGVNYYHGELVSDQPLAGSRGDDAPTIRPTRSPFPAADDVYWHPQKLPVTAMGWDVQPEALTELLLRVHQEYTGERGIQLAVTENGAAYTDTVTSDGAVRDAERSEFIEAHIAAVLDAVDGGANVKGYFVWSLLDNFEWAWGYDKRFGIVHVDYGTLERTVKLSGQRYAEMIAQRALLAVPPTKI